MVVELAVACGGAAAEQVCPEGTASVSKTMSEQVLPRGTTGCREAHGEAGTLQKGSAHSGAEEKSEKEGIAGRNHLVLTLTCTTRCLAEGIECKPW